VTKLVLGHDRCAQGLVTKLVLGNGQNHLAVAGGCAANGLENN